MRWLFLLCALVCVGIVGCGLPGRIQQVEDNGGPPINLLPRNHEDGCPLW